jgi:MOSC domain-containing protein YiiM
MQIISINIATAKPVLASGRKVLSATSKRARRRCACDANRTAGDEQADLSVPGGLEKAVYSYPVEHYAFWQAARQDVRREAGASLFDEDLPHGLLGENLGFARSSKRMVQEARCGFYLAVAAPGSLQASERFTLSAGGGAC